MIEPHSTQSGIEDTADARFLLSPAAARSSTNYQASLDLLMAQQKRQSDAVNAISYSSSIGYTFISIVYVALILTASADNHQKISFIFVALVSVFAVLMSYQLINALYVQKNIDKTVFKSLSDDSMPIQKIVFDRFAENRQTSERYLVFSSRVNFIFTEYFVWTSFIVAVGIFVGR